MSGWKFWPDRPQGPLDDAYVQARWIRPYRPGPWRVAACVGLLAVVLYGTVSALLAVLASLGVWELVLRIAIALTAFGLLLAALARCYLGGVWVTDLGIRVVRPLSTRAWTWESVADVRSVAGPVHLLGTPGRVEGRAVVLVLVDGSDVETPVTSRSPDFLGRAEAYEMAADAVEGWLEQHRRRRGRDGSGR